MHNDLIINFLHSDVCFFLPILPPGPTLKFRLCQCRVCVCRNRHCPEQQFDDCIKMPVTQQQIKLKHTKDKTPN